MSHPASELHDQGASEETERANLLSNSLVDSFASMTIEVSPGNDKGGESKTKAFWT